MIIETYFKSFVIKPKYILSFYFDFCNVVSIHAIDYVSEKNRKDCTGQWKIKYKQ